MKKQRKVIFNLILEKIIGFVIKTSYIIECLVKDPNFINVIRNKR